MNTNRVKIEKIVNGGYGLGRLDNGQVVLLHNSLEGETVNFKVIEKRKKILFGTTNSILIQNSERITPPCQYYGHCGGCNLQHCNYDKQVRIKDCIIAELFHGVPGAKQLIKPTIASPQQFGYRQRIRLKVTPDSIGFLKFRSNTIASIDNCLLAHPVINQVFNVIVKTDEFTKLQAHTDELEFLFNPKTTQITCLFHFKRKPRPTDRSSAEKLVAKTEQLERIFFSGSNFSRTGPYGFDNNFDNDSSQLLSQNIHIQNGSLTYEMAWEIGGFCQVNLKQNYYLIDLVLQKCGDVSEKTVLDLFCGMGNFSIPLAKKAHSLLGIEGQGSAIRSAKMNSLAADLSNTTFTKGPIHENCRRLKEKRKIFDIVVVDPPRQGIPGLAHTLFSLTREKLIYISCDPATLCRDLTDLQSHGFCLSEVQPIDMFPQTHHIETIAVLKKN